jgi:DNA repair exonuclease SbcCD ATPase subunit
MIEELVGLDFTTFCAMMPGAGVNVASMTDAQVKGLLEKLLRTETLGRASEEARRRHREASNSVTVKSTERKDLELAIEEVETRIIDLEDKELEFSSKRDQKLQELNEQLETIERKKFYQQSIIDSLDEYLLKKINKQTDIEEVNINISNIKIRLNNTTKHHDAELLYLEKKVTVEQAALKTSSSNLMKIRALTGVCPSCSQSVDAPHKATLEEAVLEEQVGLEGQISIIKDSITTTKKLKLEEEKYYLSLINESSVLLETLEKDLEYIELFLNKEDRSRIELLNLAERQKLLNNNKIELESNINPYSSLLNSERQVLLSKVHVQEKLNKEIDEYKSNVDILSFWVDSFSPSGIRSFMLEHITPILNQYAKQYADLITDGEMSITFHTKDVLKSGKAKEKFNIQVSQKHGGSSYASNSAGERARANLVIALALGELAALRADKTISFRFLDEPFESIDESGIEAIVALLNQQREKYNTVYVITHQDYLTQLFQNKLTIVKKDGYSVIEEN